MAIDVTAGGVGVIPIPDPDRSVVTAGRTERTAVEESTGPSTAKDTVTLTETAEQLKSLENMVAKLPVMDISRIEHLREAVANGTYESNYAKVADKMVGFERSLAGLG